MYDAIIVGARVAGSATGMLLARKGYRVLIVDRATFPSDTISTHYLHPQSLVRLRKWGLLDRLAATGCPPAHTNIMKLDGGITFAMAVPTVENISYGYQPRRTVLDKLLVDAAVEAGAEVREGYGIDGLEFDEDGTVVGIRGKSGVERARVVIGADGRNSLVARTVGTKSYDEMPSVGFWYYSYFSGAPESQRFFMQDAYGGAYGRTNDGLVCVMAGGNRRLFDSFKSDIEGNFYATLDRIDPEVGEWVRAATREERFYGIADLPGFFRVPFGPGWVLAGDAGFHKDPITASGITEAWQQAEWISDGLDEVFGGRRAFDDVMSEFQQKRDTHSRAWYEFTMRIAAMEPLVEQTQTLFRAIAANQTAADGFARVLAGLTPATEYFSMENIQTILAGT